MKQLFFNSSLETDRFLIVSLFLFISGSSALMYQVLWVRLLSLSIGSTSISISIILSIFFLGLGLGSFFAGTILNRFKNPIKIYLYAEIGIAFSAALLLPIFLNLDYYLSLFPIFGAGLAIKFFLVILLLLIPTFLIGTTFPLLMAVTIVKKDEIGYKLAHFYAINTLGAVSGALLSGIVFIPRFGLDGALYIAVSFNLFIVLVGVFLYSRLVHPRAVIKSSYSLSESAKYNNKALVVLFVTGFAAMATEVGWMKFLIIYTGNTIYGFSLILSMFLAGLTIGSFIVKFSFISKVKVETLLFIGLIALSVMLLGARVGLGEFPEIYEQLNSWQVNSFIYRWSKYFTIFLIIFPATALFGALFPIALKYYSPDINGLHKNVGRAYSVNIIAGIFGSLIAGFLIIPYYSTDLLLSTVAFLVLLSSLIFMNEINSKKKYIVWVLFSVIFILLSNRMTHIDYRSMTDIVIKRENGTNSPHTKSTIHYIKEGQTGIISILSYDSNPCIMRLLNNGMNESWIDVCNENNLLLNEFLLGEIPFLLNSDAKKAFVVGYGGGTSVKALAMNELESIDVVELDSAVLEAVKSLYNGNLPTHNDARVNVKVNDARNELLMSKNRYDIIVSQPSHPWLNGSSNIMNKDFFEIVKSRLSKDGIYAQWVPLFKIDAATLKSIIKAYTDTFDHVISFVNIPSRDFLMFGSNEPIIFDYDKIEVLMENPKIKRVIKRHNIQNAYDLMRHFALSRDELVNISSSSEPATDLNLLAETFYTRYDKIEGNTLDTVGFLKRYFSYDISNYLEEQVPKKLYEQYYYFELNGYKDEAELIKLYINKGYN